MKRISAFLARFQPAHAFTGAAVVFAALAGSFGIHTRVGEVCAAFAAMHMLLSFLETSKSVPVWLRTGATDIDKILDGATGLVPVLSALRVVLVARGAPAWALTAVSDLIAVAPYAGTTTITPATSGTVSSITMRSVDFTPPPAAHS